MFKEYIIKAFSAEYEDKILIFDFDDIESRYNYTSILEDLGFNIIIYVDAVDFRCYHQCKINSSNDKYAVLIEKNQYVPYDILKSFYCVDIGWRMLFPNLNKDVLIKDKTLDLDLLYGVYSELYEDLSLQEDTSNYIIKKVYGKNNIENYLHDMKKELLHIISENSMNYNSWLQIASKKGKAEYLAAKSQISIDLSFVDETFKRFINTEYVKISGITRSDSPIIVSRVIEFIAKKNNKIALIVLDGMSVFDFNILSADFEGIDYQENYIYAIIPTTTSLSRQCLLSGKYPVKLEKPFDLSREEKEFHLNCKSLGYLDNQISYSRGYNLDIGVGVKCLSIVLNDIDDMVHGQTQGKIGMYNDINLLAKSFKVQNLIKQLYSMGFSVYLTSDHGNTLCKGLGVVKGTGIELETKSKRMLIFKDFADISELKEKYNLIEYPGYYLDRTQYKYYICNTGTSFDTKDSIVMTHGGISIDEVIVPFIKIKVVHDG